MVSPNNLVIGNSYTLKYMSPWGNYDVTDVTVISITNDTESSNFSVDSIYSEFFSAYGLGIESYVSAINFIPDIYVCQKINSKNPIKLDPPLIIIPKLVIDFTNSIQLLQVDNVNVNINGLLAYHALAYDRGIYYQNLVSDVKLALRNLEEFGDIAVNVTTSSSDILVPVDDFNAAEAIRTSSYNTTMLADTYDKAQKTRDFRNYIIAYNDAIAAKLNYDTLSESIQSQLTSLNAAISAYNTNNTNASNVKGDITTIFNGLENGSIAIGSAEYISLKQQIETFVLTA